MQFINPIEILEFETDNLSTIDSSQIKRAKRKLFAEIDLSDSGVLNYKGIFLTKTDCEKVIDYLENSDQFEFYSYISLNKNLNDFLVNGDEKLFSAFQHDSIYKYPAFLRFIGPFFAPQYDKAILKAFSNKDTEQLRKILRTQILLNPADFNTAFKGLTAEIQNRLEQIDSITQKIKDEESLFSEENIGSVIETVKELFPIELLNLLPSYFQSQINKIANSINFLQLAIWNEFNITLASLNLLEYLLKLNIESVHLTTFQKNHEIVRKKHEERIEQEKNAPTLKQWATILLTIQSEIKSVENKVVKASDAFEKINYLVNIVDLNSLPSFANEIRTQIGYSLRSLSISCWNKQNDIKSAIALISFALRINIDEEAKLKFIQDKVELENIEKSYKGILVCHFCEKNPTEENCGLNTTIYKEISRSYFPRRVQFSYTDITIPRCKFCKVTHSDGNERFLYIFFMFIILGVTIGAMTKEKHYFIGGIIGAFSGWIIGKIIERNKVRKNGIKAASASILSKHPLLINKIKEGWTFSKPSA